MRSFQITACVALGHQFGTTYVQFGDEIVRLDPQRRCGRREPYRLRRVERRGGVLPSGILAKKRVDALATLLAAGTIHRGEVIENKMQDLAWTIAEHHFG